MLALIGKSLLGALLAYAIVAGLGAVLLNLFSNNTHDKAQMVAMTAFFVLGPIGAVLGFIGTLVYQLMKSGG